MAKYVYYNKNTGEVYKFEKRSSSFVPPKTHGRGGRVLEVDHFDSSIHTVDVTNPKKPTIVEKTECPAVVVTPTIMADGDDQCKITDIPSGALVTITFPDHETITDIVKDGEVTFTSDVVGTIFVVILCGKFKQKEIKVVAK